MKPDKISPAYYLKGIEVMDYAESHRFGSHEFAILKYITRWKVKHPDAPVTDLHKARWFLDRLIKIAEEDAKQI